MRINCENSSKGHLKKKIAKTTLNKTPNTPLFHLPTQKKQTNKQTNKQKTKQNKKSILHLYELLPMCIKEEKNKGENFFSRALGL